MTITTDDDRAIGLDVEENDRAITATIADVFPSAIKIHAEEIRVGDRVFDTFGGTYEILERRRRGRWIDTVREDGWEDRFRCDDLITIQRGGA